LRAGSLTLLLSPTQRQSGELFRDKVLRLYGQLGCPVPARRETALQLDLVNGSRIVSLPGEEATIRGYSGVALLVIDEASRVPDPLYFALRPMLAVSRGRLVALSTPFGRRGWFHVDWTEGLGWEKICVTAKDCPRITPSFLQEERVALGEHWFEQEYNCEFMDAVDSVFRYEDIHAMISEEVEPLWSE
jgi:hypothetical protein